MVLNIFTPKPRHTPQAAVLSSPLPAVLENAVLEGEESVAKVLSALSCATCAAARLPNPADFLRDAIVEVSFAKEKLPRKYLATHDPLVLRNTHKTSPLLL